MRHQKEPFSVEQRALRVTDPKAYQRLCNARHRAYTAALRQVAQEKAAADRNETRAAKAAAIVAAKADKLVGKLSAPILATVKGLLVAVVPDNSD